ncbi:MAG TPA: hypothetical protein VGT03_10355 [Candidatus Acidoferrales bacterium]|nr:hypothetical protein [Candidatus Acidoferrales bacterium]
MYVNRRTPRAADFPGFSLRIQRGTRKMMSVIYESNGHSTTFEGTLTGPGWKQIELLIPADFHANHLDRVVADLAKGIGELGYEYRILRRGDAEVIPESERKSALAELRKMGWEPEVSADHSQVELKHTDGSREPSPQDALAQSERMARLVAALHGTRYKLEELARSPGAIN